MSPPGRPKGEYRSAQREATPVSPPGRPKSEFRNALHEGTPVRRVAPGLCETVVAAALAAALAAGCADRPAGPTPLVPSRQTLDRGAVALHAYGCGSCHRIPGIPSADGIVGPPLVDMGRRVYLGRGLPNTAQNMARWIRTPQQFAPGSAMPDMPVSDADATAIAAWLLHRD